MSGETHLFGRRQLLRAAAVAAASGWISDPARARDTATAVVFLSRSSNTRMLAGDLSRRLGADLVEVHPRAPWPENYEEMVAWASRWRESESLLPLREDTDLGSYQTVFLGFPIWGGALPAPMRAFLSNSDLSGKAVLPFITHGGYGPGDAMAEVRQLAPAAHIAKPFVLRCDQERDNLDALRVWVAGTGR